MKPLATLLAVSFAAIAVPGARANVKLPAIFSDHAVLQQDATVPVWGWADAGEMVEVSIAGQTKSASPEAGGRWMVKFDGLKAGGPHVLTVKGRNTVTVKDVLIGEVWLASGQSNMAFLVRNALHFDKEQPAANFPQMRMFTVARHPVRTPQADCKGAWVVCAPRDVGGFSAVAYFFGRELHQKLGVPVGLVHSSVGGTDIAAWTSEEAQSKNAELKAHVGWWEMKDGEYDPAKAKAAYEKQLAEWETTAKEAKAGGKEAPRKPAAPVLPAVDNNRPANLFNGMIAPLIPFAVRGAFWYQGEHNTGSTDSALRYRTQLPLLIEDWRARWGSEFPFAWVQLPNFDRPGLPADGRPLVREAMLQTLKVKNTGMAVTIDVGDPKDNHPKNKQEVGRRLSLWALGAVYGQKVASICGPLPDGHTIRGGEVVLSFKHTDGGLVAKDGALKGFVIAGEDRQWVNANARIDGDKVIVSHPGVKAPVAVRYAWAWNPDCNLYNGAGLPASPFRTDEWN